MKNLTAEEIQNMSQKDLAYLIIQDSKKSINTLDLFKSVCDKLGLVNSESMIGDFYTSMMTDKRFVIVDGKWDLRDNHTSDKVIVKTDDSLDEEEDNLDEITDYDTNEDEEEDNFDKENEDDEYESSDDDDLGDLVIIDEDEMEENN